MIVVDASAVVELVLGLAPHDAAVAALMRANAAGVFAPYLIDAEVATVIRRRTRASAFDGAAGRAHLDDFAALPIRRHPHLPLLDRAYELRDNATIYDALYITLAEVLGATLVTSDARLASVPGVRAKIHVLA